MQASGLERLNDPQYDAFVALRDDQPVGAVALYQVGEIGRIVDLYVCLGARRAGIASCLLNYVVAASRRWELRPLCTQVAAENVAARALLGKLGFEEGGTIVGFWRQGAVAIAP